MVCIQFNEEYKVLTDEQGIMLSEGDATWLLDRLLDHFNHKNLEMEAIGRRLLEKSHPKMVNQFNFDWFKYENNEPDDDGEANA